MAFDKKVYMKEYAKTHRKQMRLNQLKYEKREGIAPWAKRRSAWLDERFKKPLSFQDYFPG